MDAYRSSIHIKFKTLNMEVILYTYSNTSIFRRKEKNRSIGSRNNFLKPIIVLLELEREL